MVNARKLIRREKDQTHARVRAIVKFDDLCHCAYRGLYPEPKFERGVDRSPTAAVFARDRNADARLEMQRLAARIGEDAQAILFHRIFERMQFTWMETQGMGGAEYLGKAFLRALDAVAVFYGYSQPSRAVRAMEERLAGL